MEHNSDNDGLLYVGKDSDLSTVYIVTKDFVQKGEILKLTVRFVFSELSQSCVNYHYFLKDCGCDYEKLAYIEEFIEFDDDQKRIRKLHTSYRDIFGKMIYQSVYDVPEWIPLKNVSRTGIVRRVYEVVKTQLVDKDKLNDKPIEGISNDETEFNDIVNATDYNQSTVPFEENQVIEPNITQIHPMEGITPPASRKPVSTAIWFLLVVAVLLVIGITINNYSKNQQQKKIAAEQKAKQELEYNRFKQEFEEKSKPPEQSYPLTRRGLPNIYDYDAWRKGGREGLKEYDHEKHRKKLYELDQRLDALKRNNERHRYDR